MAPTPPAGLIRPAEPRDLPAMIELLRLLFNTEADFQPDPAKQRRGLELLLAAPDRGTALVLEIGGTAVGMATAQLVISTAEGAPSAWIEDVVVAPGQRGCGWGTALLDAIIAWARAQGCTRCQLLADNENTPALAFYHSLGWESTQLGCHRIFLRR